MRKCKFCGAIARIVNDRVTCTNHDCPVAGSLVKPSEWERVPADGDPTASDFAKRIWYSPVHPRCFPRRPSPCQRSRLVPGELLPQVRGESGRRTDDGGSQPDEVRRLRGGRS